MKKIVVMLVVMSLASCGVDPDEGRRVLKAQGMTDIKIGSYAAWGCSKDDTFGSYFTAKSTSGDIVNGVICGGWLKGYTVRFD